MTSADMTSPDMTSAGVPVPADDGPDGPPEANPRSSSRSAVLALAVVFGYLALLGYPLLLHPQVPGYVDHPYKFSQQQSFTEAWDAGRDPLGWTQEFNGGYPELQFYPPGVAALGSALDHVPGIDTAISYWMVLLLAWFTPGLAVTGSMLMGRAAPRAAAAAGIVVGTVSFGYSGTRAGVAVGVLGSRVALGSAVLAGACALVAADPARRHRTASLLGAAAASAVSCLMHVYFLPLVVVALAVGAIRRHRAPLPDAGAHGDGDGDAPDPGSWRPELAAALAIGSGVLVAGVWWWGLVAMRASTVPYRPTDEPSLWRLIDVAFGRLEGFDWGVLMVLAVVGWRATAGSTRRHPLQSAIVPCLVIEAVVVVTDNLLDIRFFPAQRVIDLVILFAAINAGIGVASMLAAPPSLRRTCYIVVVAVWGASQVALAFPTDFNESIDEYDLGELHLLWDRLEGSSGRVIFTTSMHSLSHLESRTWRETGRESLNSGPTIATPVQAKIGWGPDATGIPSLSNVNNNVSMFAITWADARRDPGGARAIAGHLRELGVTTVVAGPGVYGDQPVDAVEAMRGVPDAFAREEPVGPFSIFRVVGADPARVRADHGTVDVTSPSPPTISATVRTDVPTKVLVHMLRSPYWTVTLDGAPVATRDGTFREIELDVPAGEHRVEATVATPDAVRRGRPVLPALGIIGLAVALVLGRRPRVRASGP